MNEKSCYYIIEILDDHTIQPYVDFTIETL